MSRAGAGGAGWGGFGGGAAFGASPQMGAVACPWVAVRCSTPRACILSHQEPPAFPVRAAGRCWERQGPGP